ncbi:actin-binding anillin-like isoform X2 [Brachionus plicatilis]|uniref:Actin-binding anillin-like isoform X2 n=1 Tax=Brachionus plicatilis TaxID=10195 RepID=A0A3M7Q8I3_BRAPC|nr:actin-binding anillin-like isoform X2 [Brachionus plicatilis]
MSRNEENFYDLSQTLIERRKRLHELATEINQWEDESQTAAQPKAVQLTPKQFKWSDKENQRTQTQKSLSVQTIKSKFENAQLQNANESTCQNLTPKSIIEKFEQMSRGSNNQPKFKTSSTRLNKPEAANTSNKEPSLLNESSFINTDNIKPKSIIEKFECLSKGSASLKSSHSASGSLTYVSSLQSACDDEDTDFKAKYTHEQIYEDTSLFDETSVESPETYSVSASDYTGSLMNQDEFDDDYEDEYDSLDDHSDTVHKSPLKLSYSADVSSPPGTDTASSVGSDMQPFSIREYRKQKKSARRSSIMPKQKKAKSPLKQTEPLKKSKYSERIKELEELIKHEDNIIHQTGIALERCVTDLTATNEHIECNRLLLISCQKRQAYLFEINRLKEALSGHAGHQCESTDLTGLLIFSDLQLPIKESYLNKLKAGDDKRIFYFLCLIRNGIQVLQTQVINVQELISTKDTCLVFPNRMAINNVDINFRVKIDIYTLEVMPNVNHKVKHTSSNVKFFSPFKFHHHHENASSSGYSEQRALTSQRAKTSNFIHVDTVEIGQADICRSKFKLSISSSAIPLSGVLFVNVRCMPSKSIELKGFMSVFEESKFWERRWCFLNNYNISYWKYPEDEYRNGPLGVINLTKCVNDKVCVLPRDVCARKYSFELLTDEEQDVKMFRLSADSRDQANDWITNVNFALANLRLWNPAK